MSDATSDNPFKIIPVLGQRQPTPADAFRMVYGVIGSQHEMARICGASQPWIRTHLVEGRQIPAEWVVPLEVATTEKGFTIPREWLRPDLYREAAA